MIPTHVSVAEYLQRPLPSSHDKSNIVCTGDEAILVMADDSPQIPIIIQHKDGKRSIRSGEINRALSKFSVADNLSIRVNGAARDKNGTDSDDETMAS
jgi:hypothetical protein